MNVDFHECKTDYGQFFGQPYIELRIDDTEILSTIVTALEAASADFITVKRWKRAETCLSISNRLVELERKLTLLTDAYKAYERKKNDDL